MLQMQLNLTIFFWKEPQVSPDYLLRLPGAHIVCDTGALIMIMHVLLIKCCLETMKVGAIIFGKCPFSLIR